MRRFWIGIAWLAGAADIRACSRGPAPPPCRCPSALNRAAEEVTELPALPGTEYGIQLPPANRSR